MNTKHVYLAIIIILLGAVGFLVTTRTPKYNQHRQAQTQNESKNNCVADQCLAVDNLNYPAGELTTEAKSALKKALDDEYKAHATYEAIIAKHGNVRPFIMIIRAEEQHISSLKALFDKYGLETPENIYRDKVTSPDSIVNACAAGVEAEIANASLYKDELLPNVNNYEDITLVFTNLMNASQQKHLKAFQKCD